MKSLSGVKQLNLPAKKYLKTHLKVITLFLLALLCEDLRAQVNFSTDKNYLKTKTEGNNLLLPFKNNYPDSTIDQLSQFESRNFRGNIGLAQPDYLLKYGTDAMGFRFAPNTTRNNRFSEEEVMYGKTKGPFANLTGITGDKQLQMFRLFYSQSIKERLNITLKFNRYNSVGFYQKQQAFTNNFFASSNYTGKNQRFGFYLFLLNNGNKNQESGGITDNVLSDSTVLLNKEILAVRTHSATRDNRELKFEFNPWVRLNSVSDSLNKAGHYLQIKSKISNSTLKYKDVNLKADNFYRNYYYDSITSNDSSHIRQYCNELNYTLRAADKKSGVWLGYRHEINSIWQKKDSSIMNHLATAGWHFSGKPSDTLSAGYVEDDFNAQYVVSGKNAGNYKLENRLNYWLNSQKQHRLYFNVLAESRNADYIYNYWLSNHFKWQNNGCKSQQTVQANAGIEMGRLFKAEVLYQNLFNTLYFDQYSLPRQYDKTIENLAFSLSFSKIFFKHLGVYLGHTFQSTNKPAYQRLPANISTARLFYKGNLFRNVLQLQIGSQVQVYQSFYGYAYMPSTQAFYLQDTYATAACPFVDVYLNARVKPVSVFIKVENALQGFVGNNYSFMPGYYQPDRAFRFGISWVFFD
ncbi:MAG: hypothetical protein IT236_05355 [Bacteroidia bacterium]|nr:hypothetical protein [Bacteroidia bacterium]